jgi:paraquat-inducible protein A
MTIACPDCGTVQVLGAPPPDSVACCARCDGALERRAGRSLTAGLALASATLLLLIPANVLPVLEIGLAGARRESHLASGVAILIEQDWVLLALAIAAFGIVVPLARFALLTASLGALRLGRRPTWLGPAFRWSLELAPWSMADVFLIGAVIGYTRIAVHLAPHIEAGGWCFIAAAFLAMATDGSIDARTAWRAIGAEREPPPGRPVISCAACDLVVPLEQEGRRCPRCRARLRGRSPDAIARTAALVAAGFLLYLPANYFPMTSYLQLGMEQTHTIISGIGRLFDTGFWPLGIVIFCTSIAVPLLKLIGLSWLLLSVRRRSARALTVRTRLHRLIRAVGRWSNVDVFTIAVFAPLLQFGQIVTVRAGIGAEAFATVVVLTMLATRSFDARLMWDAAERRP